MSSRIISQAITKASDIYAEGLFHLGHGYPLWGPEPDETCGEVRLGDVGYIRDGHFNLLFNCMRGRDDPVNSKQGVPDNFEIFSPPPNTTIQRPNEITATMLHSQSARVNDVSMGLNAGYVFDTQLHHNSPHSTRRQASRSGRSGKNPLHVREKSGCIAPPEAARAQDVPQL